MVKGSFDVLLAFEVLVHIEDDRGSFPPGGTGLPSRRCWYSPSPLTRSAGTRPMIGPAISVATGAKDCRTLTGRIRFSIIHLECYGFPRAKFSSADRARHHARLLRRRNGIPQIKLPSLKFPVTGVASSGHGGAALTPVCSVKSASEYASGIFHPGPFFTDRLGKRLSGFSPKAAMKRISVWLGLIVTFAGGCLFLTPFSE